MIKVVLDAVGGDHGPSEIIAGAVRAVEKGFVTADQILLTGPQAKIEEALAAHGDVASGFVVVDAPDELAPHDSPVVALKTKPRNAIAVGIGLLREKKADAFVSAGSTGTVVAAATMMLPRLEGIRRPGIAVTIEGEKGPFMVVDVGANPQPKAVHLMHYALMGSAYYHDTFGVDKPRVGLMNIGTEDGKGNPLIKEARDLMEAAPIEFIGNVEGVDVFNGGADVVVADGFTGNVLLKVSEGLAEHMVRTFHQLMGEAGIEAASIQKVIGAVMRRVDFSEYGGALLLGTEGSVTICHGRSKAPAISNAIRFATKAVGAKVNQHIVTAARAAADATGAGSD